MIELILNYIFAAGIIFSHIIGYIVSGLALIFIYKNWETIKKDKLIFFITLFLLYGFVWAFFTEYKKEAFEEMFTYLTSWLFPFILGCYIIDNIKKENLIKTYISVFTVVLFFSVLSYFGVFYQEIAGSQLARKGMHLHALMWHISCGAMCVLLSCFTLIPLLFKENLSKNKRILLFSLTIFFMICLYLSGSRGYYIAGGITYLLIFVFYIFKTGKFKIPLFICILSMIFVVIMFHNNKFMRERIYNTSITKEWSLTNRIDAYKVALSIYKDNFIFGVGPRQSVRQAGYHEKVLGVKKDPESGRHMHSMYLNILSDFGSVGFIIFGIIIFLIFKRLFFIYKKENSILALCLLFAWCSLLIGDCFDTVLRGPRVAMDYFWLTGLILAKDFKSKIY